MNDIINIKEEEMKKKRNNADFRKFMGSVEVKDNYMIKIVKLSEKYMTGINYAMFKKELLKLLNDME